MHLDYEAFSRLGQVDRRHNQLFLELYFSGQGGVAFLKMQLSLDITMRTALNMSENVMCSFWFQAVAPTLSKSTYPNRSDPCL